MRIIKLLIFLLIGSYCFAQQGSNYSIELSDFDNFSEKKNIAFYSDHIEKLDDEAACFYVSREFAVAELPSKQPFIALSCSYDYKYLEGSIEIAYRTRTKKKWGSWENIKLDVHTNSIYYTKYGEQVFISNETKAVQFKLSADASSKFELSKFNFRFFFPGDSKELESKKKLNKDNKSLNCSCPLPAMEYRLDWCPSGNCPSSSNPSSTTVSHLVVHHSAGSNSSPDWAATVRSIWDYHVNNRGWADIAYNYLIDPNGVIYEGRGNDVTGAHFSCMNTNTMGVCLLGDFTTATPSAAMITSLELLLGWKACDIDKDPRDTSYFSTGMADLINLCGHRDGNTLGPSCTVTECPGDQVYTILTTIRNDVYTYTQNCTLNPSYANTIISSMDASPTPIYPNTSTNLNLGFKNVGDAAINENLGISFRIDGVEVGTRSFSALAPNQSATESISYSFSNPGTFNYCVYIDGASNELNVANNSFCISLVVLASPDTSTAILSSPLPELVVYPNPASEYIYIKGLERLSYKVKIYNVLGQEVLASSSNLIYVESLARGTYSLQIEFESGLGPIQLQLVKE
ncbi:MAG: N-acetylmuramoyl-L-alanine amidase [Chitinophagales bacterium]|nr:N-acetylmuramoyl-L-alanine amidase [Chitinophagales bacterium]